MWKFLSGLFGGPKKQRSGGIGDVVKALEESDAARPLPTLVCRQCGLKYANTGTYLQGSRCPACYPNG